MKNYLVVTKQHLIRHIQPTVDKLNAEVIYCSPKKYPLWFDLAYAAEEYIFYFKTIKHQGEYWKNRIFELGRPRWQRFPFLRHLKRFYVPPAHILSEVKKYNAVISTHLLYPPTHEDIDYALATKIQGIPLIGMVLTFDGTTTKSPIQIVPDIMLCWNESQKEDLIKFHKLSPDIIYPVGPYYFESWLSGKASSRKDFCNKIGLDSAKPIVTYLCSSAGQIIEEEELIMGWANANMDSQLIIKAHPQKTMRLKIDAPDIKFIDSNDFQLKKDIYTHSEACYTINSSSSIEALFTGCKVIPVITDQMHPSIHYAYFREFIENKDWFNLRNELPSTLIQGIINSCSVSKPI